MSMRVCVYAIKEMDRDGYGLSVEKVESGKERSIRNVNGKGEDVEGAEKTQES